MNFGFPYCYGKGAPDPEFGKKRACDQFTHCEVALGPHVAALGMRFYTGKMFPAEYRDQIFIAEHGSWNRSTPIGYRITLVRFHEGKPPAMKFSPRDGDATVWHGGGRWIYSSSLTARCLFQMISRALSTG